MLLLAVLHVVSHATSASPINNLIECFEFESIQVLFIHLKFQALLNSLLPTFTPITTGVSCRFCEEGDQAERRAQAGRKGGGSDERGREVDGREHGAGAVRRDADVVAEHLEP